ncbi:MAG TPA: hypothetical protein VFJ85_18620 [Acidimicrobiales bacterium]|nr:hypothetical protein [Acidimicrobiales bacterium]
MSEPGAAAAEALAASSSALADEDRAYIESEGWVPPPIVRAAILARALVVHFAEIPAEERGAILSVAERFMVTGDDGDKAAVATGFLEALANAGDRSEIDMDRLWSELGEESKAYLRAWDEFNGITPRP